MSIKQEGIDILADGKIYINSGDTNSAIMLGSKVVAQGEENTSATVVEPSIIISGENGNIGCTTLTADLI